MICVKHCSNFHKKCQHALSSLCFFVQSSRFKLFYTIPRFSENIAAAMSVASTTLWKTKVGDLQTLIKLLAVAVSAGGSQGDCFFFLAYLALLKYYCPRKSCTEFQILFLWHRTRFKPNRCFHMVFCPLYRF